MHIAALSPRAVPSLLNYSSDAGGSPPIYVSGVFCMLYDKVHTEVRIIRIPTILVDDQPSMRRILGVRLLRRFI